MSGNKRQKKDEEGPPLKRSLVNNNSFYVGSTKFEIKRETNPLVILDSYLKNLNDELLGYLQALHISNDEEIIDHAPRILSHLFCAILYSNNVLLPKIRIRVTFRSVQLSELAYIPSKQLTSGGDNSLTLYFAIEDIADYLLCQTDHAPHSIQFENKIIDHRAFLKSACANRQRKITPIFANVYKNDIFNRKLIAIADHLATHYFDEYRNGCTDWINHENFGNQGFTTVESIFKFTATTIPRMSKVPSVVVGSTNSGSINTTIGINSLHNKESLTPIHINDINSQVFNYDPAFNC